MRRTIHKIIQPLQRRIYLMLARGVLTALNDGAGRQYVQLKALKGEVKDNVERLQDYGFTSSPLAGAQVLMACISGNRDHPLAIRVDDPSCRMHGLQPGEVAVYDHNGNYILIRTDNTIVVHAPTVLVQASEKCRMETPLLQVTGEVIDLCDTHGQSMDDMREIYNIHTHDENNALHGPTDEPNQEMNS